MTKPLAQDVVWLSDLHFVAEGLIQGHDPRLRLRAAIDYINEFHSQSMFCVISGDLVDLATEQNYRALKSELDRLLIPYFPLSGNHDDKTLLRQVFDLPGVGMNEFIQYAVPTEAGVFMCLDSQRPGSDAGEFCTKRMQWLDHMLAEYKDSPAYLFLHHPPMALRLPMLDPDNMENGDAFLDLLSKHQNVKHLFLGHVHRPICGTVRGIPFAVMRSTLYQAPPPVPAWDWDSFAPAAEAPNLGILTFSNGDVTLQYREFCKYEFGLERSKS
ncbi:phosphodiesterase [Cochlodiniinecator piscidefendens]|uniref:phosphodiesterase n=1 Tax=Cochlodiniinecator piscidefendens TaxID=2715756 RepID=UPI002F3F39FA